VSLQNFAGVRCTMQQFVATFYKSEKPVLHPELCFKKIIAFERAILTF
jgi:hypothetical protein